MGHTIGQWTSKVSSLVRDEAGRDLPALTIEDVGLRPAFAQLANDRPLKLTAEITGDGSPYLTLPAGWSAGFSDVTEVEFPARQNPPQILDDQSWRTVRSAADASIEQILLDHTPAASQYVRVTFTATWPYPGSDEAADLVNDVEFEAVAALAASFCCSSLANQAARSRAGGLSVDFSAGERRAQTLTAAAERYEGIYRRLLGLSGGDGDKATPAPAYGRFDFDPSHSSVFHGGRV